MDLTTSGPFSNKRAVTTPVGLLPVVKALLTGMAIHPLKGNAEDYRVYRARIQKAIDALGDGPTLEQAYPQAEEAVHALTRPRSAYGQAAALAGDRAALHC
jgi:hypothetical protein